MGKMEKFLLPAIGGLIVIGILSFGLLPTWQAAPPVRGTEAGLQQDVSAPPTPSQPSPPSERKSSPAYDASNLNNMFGAPQAPTPTPTPQPGPVVTPPVPPTPPPTPEDPLQNYSYTGHAVLGDQSYALIEDNRNHEGVWVKEGDDFRGFTVKQISPKSLQLRQGETLRDLAISDKINVVPLAKDAPVTVLPDPGTLTSYRGQTGMSYYFQVTGRQAGSLWGSGPYTDDSNIGTAAVHAGLLRDGQQGVVRVTILPGYNSYDGSTRNGVTSNAYGPWEGSFHIAAR